jgi:hypothetical protein
VQVIDGVVRRRVRARSRSRSRTAPSAAAAAAAAASSSTNTTPSAAALAGAATARTYSDAARAELRHDSSDASGSPHHSTRVYSRKAVSLGVQRAATRRRAESTGGSLDRGSSPGTGLLLCVLVSTCGFCIVLSARHQPVELRLMCARWRRRCASVFTRRRSCQRITTTSRDRSRHRHRRHRSATPPPISRPMRRVVAATPNVT